MQNFNRKDYIRRWTIHLFNDNDETHIIAL